MNLINADTEKLIGIIQQDIDTERMLETVTQLSQYYRYSGTPAAEKAVDLLLEKLERYGIPNERLSYEAVFSQPTESVIRLPQTGETLAAMPCVYSGACKNLCGELMVDPLSEEGAIINENTQQHRFDEAKGKFILTRSSDVTLSKRAKSSGALGILYMWPSAEDYLHHFLMGASIWGTATPDTIDSLAFLPTMEITHNSGLYLLALLKQGPVELEIDCNAVTEVRRSSIPVATIPGKSDKYVLISGHYDSWYEGATDNATANSIMLELARQLYLHREELYRGVKIAWWSGHSDARYSGSTWFCDTFREELRQNCVAHINLDMCGAKNSDVMIPRTTLMEGMDLTCNIIEKLTGRRPRSYIPMCRAADQSFYNADIPLPITVKIEPLPENVYFSNPGGGPWWHSYYDTLDKVDPDTLTRDARFHVELVLRIANSTHLPVKMSGFLGIMVDFLADIQKDCIDAFHFAPIFEQLHALREPLIALEKIIPDMEADTSDDIIHKVAGTLIRLAYSSSSDFEYDPAGYFYGKGSEGFIFFRLRRAANVTRENCPPDRFVFICTDFLRQTNRLVRELKDLRAYIERLL